MKTLIISGIQIQAVRGCLLSYENEICYSSSVKTICKLMNKRTSGDGMLQLLKREVVVPLVISTLSYLSRLKRL
jgi:hypothetical protein